MTIAALLTAVAASPKPTAISRTLPGYSAMSPAANTRGWLVAIEAVQVRYEVDDAGTGELVRGRQRPGGEAAQPAGDQDRAAVQARPVGEPDDRPVLPVRQRARLYPEQVLRPVRLGLLDEVVHQVPAPEDREAGDVAHLLLRVHRGDLATRLGQRVDQYRRQPPEAGVVRREQPGRAGSHDGEVNLAQLGSPVAHVHRPKSIDRS